MTIRTPEATPAAPAAPELNTLPVAGLEAVQSAALQAPEDEGAEESERRFLAD
jgi:hypothetical protein